MPVRGDHRQRDGPWSPVRHTWLPNQRPARGGHRFAIAHASLAVANPHDACVAELLGQASPPRISAATGSRTWICTTSMSSTTPTRQLRRGRTSRLRTGHVGGSRPMQGLGHGFQDTSPNVCLVLAPRFADVEPESHSRAHRLRDRNQRPPGRRAGLHGGSTTEVSYTADMVKLILTVTSVRTVRAFVSGRCRPSPRALHPGRVQETLCGSYARSSPTETVGGGDAFTLIAWTQPTLPATARSGILRLVVGDRLSRLWPLPRARRRCVTPPRSW